MKSKEQRLLDTFSDMSMAIDPKFKHNLRGQIVQGSNARKRWYAMPKLVLAPLAVLIILGISIFANTQQASAPHPNPLRPKAVSAQELLKRAETAGKSFDYTKYDYFEYSFTSTHIHKDIPGCGPSEGSAEDPVYTITNKTYLYKQPNHGPITAMYSVSSDNIHGQLAPGTSVYDDKGTYAYDYSDIQQPDITDGPFNFRVVNGAPVALLVDAKGNTLPTDSVVPTYRSGREVYDFYIKDNPASVNPGHENEQYCGSDFEQHIVMDAQTFLLLQDDSYAGEAKPENLYGSLKMDLYYTNLSLDAALNRMKAAGFDKEHAQSGLPGGKDGEGLGPGGQI